MADLKSTQKEIEALNDEIASLSSKFKNQLNLDDLDESTRKVADRFANDISKSTSKIVDDFTKQDGILAKINQKTNASNNIGKEIIKNEARKNTILRNAELLRKQGVVLDEISLALLVDAVDKNIKNLHIIQEKNIEAQKERDYLKEGVEKLKEQYSFTRLSRLALAAIGKSLLDASKLTANIAKNTGLSANNSLKLQKSFASTATNSGKVFINSERLNKSFTALTQQTGLIADFSGDTLIAFTELTEQLGMGVEQATQLSLISKLQGGNVEKTLSDTVATVNAINKQNGVNLSSKAIFDDISNASSAIVVSLGMNPQLLAEAAAEARSLGSTLSEIDSIAGSILNFESSIENELTAELLTGKQLNFEKMRLLALNNDLAGVSKELVENEAIFTEFSTGNRLEQQAIADAIGLSRDQLADMIKLQQFQTLGAKGIGVAYSEQTYQQMLQLDAATKLQESFTKLKSAVVDMVTPFIPFIDGLATGLSSLAAMKPVLKTISYLMAGLAIRAAAVAVQTTIASGGLNLASAALMGVGVTAVGATAYGMAQNNSTSNNEMDYDKFASAMSKRPNKVTYSNYDASLSKNGFN